MRGIAPALILSLISCPADAGWPAPLCRDPDVLDYLALRLRGENPYSEIIRDSVAENPSTRPDASFCAVEVRTVLYDAWRSGDPPEIHVTPRTYYVRSFSHGFEVTLNP